MGPPRRRAGDEPVGKRERRGIEVLHRFVYDWNLDEWVSLPIGFQIGRVQRVAGQAMRFSLNPQWNLKDITGASKAKIVFTVTLLAPVK